MLSKVKRLQKNLRTRKVTQYDIKVTACTMHCTRRLAVNGENTARIGVARKTLAQS